MVTLYDDSTKKLIENKLDNIILKSRRYALKNILEPTMDEYNKVLNIILNYIKLNKRIIYGGYAWHNLIKHKNKKDGIYEDDLIGQPDVEFYSYEPIHDIVKICNELHQNSFKYIRASEAQHQETYTIFVNQLGYVDISYMPKQIFHKIPIYKINNMHFIHPKIITIDILRQMNDPINSYWRLSKQIPRINKILKYYPIDTKRGKLTKFKHESNIQKILDFIRKKIIIESKLLVCGYYGYQYYNEIANNMKDELYVPYYDVISYNLEEDVKNIKKILVEYNDKITVEEYHPFFQFLDRKIVFKINNHVLLNVYGNNEMCIPYFYLDKKKINIVTFPYILQMLLILNIYHTIYENKVEANNLDYLLEDIIKKRNNYLKKNNKTILDDTPFEEFRIDCIGKTIDPSRKYRINLAEKFKSKKKFKQFKFEPPNDNFNPDIFNFKNTSGKINTSNKNRIFY